MELKLVMKTARSVSFEIAEGGRYFTGKEYEVFLNGVSFGKTDRVITSLFGLKPETKYCIRAVSGRDGGEKGDTRDGGDFGELQVVTDYEFVTLDVREFGARGDGVQNDTAYIQAAIMACPPMGRVLIPAGKYKVNSLFLKSDLRMELEKGAELSADTVRWNYPVLPGMIESYDEKEEYNLGSWEGNPLPMFSGILTGIYADNIVIYGEGEINGNASYDNWWQEAKVMEGAFRPRLLFLNHCTNVKVQGLAFHDSPAWVIHPYFSKKLQFCSLTIENPQDSPNTDGLNPESCQDVRIEGIRFSLGDDCVAVKSGKIYMGKKYKTPSEAVHVRHCLMEDGHGAVTVGSEMAGGIRNLVVEDCIFRHTDRGLRIKTRRGRGKDGVLDDIVFRNISMDHVMTPFVANCFYFCDPDGKSGYVQSREACAADERTPLIKKLEFINIECRNCHVAAAYFEGLPEQPIEEIVMKNVAVSYAGQTRADVPAMSVGVSPCSRKGIYAGNVNKLVLSHVTVTGQEGEALECRNVKELVKEQL